MNKIILRGIFAPDKQRRLLCYARRRCKARVFNTEYHIAMYIDIGISHDRYADVMTDGTLVPWFARIQQPS